MTGIVAIANDNLIHEQTYLTPMIKILHNDTCPICSREVASYDRLAQKHDIPVETCGLNDAVAWGLSQDQAARVFRVEKDGEVLEGMPAFRALWAELPYWRHLSTITGLPVLRQITDVLYTRVAAPILYALHERRNRP